MHMKSLLLKIFILSYFMFEYLLIITLIFVIFIHSYVQLVDIFIIIKLINANKIRLNC